MRQLIGDRHWLTDGHHKEIIVREFLNRYISPRLQIGSGFVKNRSHNLCSPEIDILISDWSSHSAFFNEGGVQIAPPSSTVAYIEMKSKFTASSLEKALSGISNTQRAHGDQASHIWRSVCFASIRPTFESFSSTVQAKILAIMQSQSVTETLAASELLPTCITSFDSYSVFIRPNLESNTLVLNFFSTAKLSASVAFMDRSST